MNIFRRDKGAAPSPSVPPRHGKAELDRPVTHGKNTQDAGTAPQKNESAGETDPTARRTGVMGVMQKVNPFKSASQSPAAVSKAPSSESLEPGTESAKNPGGLRGVMQKVNPFKSQVNPSTVPPRVTMASKAPSTEPLEQGGVSVAPPETGRDAQGKQDTQPLQSELSSSSASLVDNNNLPEKQEDAIPSGRSSSSESVDDSAIERHSIWYVDADAASEAEGPPAEAPKRRTAEVVALQMLPLADVPAPTGGTAEDPLEDEEGLLAWWRTVEGWGEWNQAVQDDEPEEVVEDAADRVFMAARLFVRLFNRGGASLQKRILDLLELADAADNFHKKTITASVGGGVASIAGSVTTITGLILAPFTAGTSLIVTAVGIGIATAGGVASASANITDTVHSKTDRKKVEKMIQDYEEEVNDIRKCLVFMQEGMDVLEEWNFEKYAESISKKHLNQNMKHVMKEGGRAGKALVINTETLIGTIQVLGVAGGAAKAAQVMSITTGVMSGLFLALDVFFLAKDSMELKKGAKTDFAAKIREVCKDLQDGLLELNRIKEELQKTMDGVEVEVDEEEEDVEVLKSDLKKLIELEE
ncbi:uncharacterized protein [Brachionichthys hirsutus]|uniref:uncharacterized protein n=1 Tax=Brachionichthys hirsutus TaxID=412623 RepID=UPI0036050B8E